MHFKNSFISNILKLLFRLSLQSSFNFTWLWLFQIFFCYQFLVLFHMVQEYTCYDPYYFKFVVVLFYGPDYSPVWWIFYVHLGIQCILCILSFPMSTPQWSLESSFHSFVCELDGVYKERHRKQRSYWFCQFLQSIKVSPCPHFLYLVFINLSTTLRDNSLCLRTESLVIYLPSLSKTGTCKIYFKSKFTAHPIIKLTNKYLLQHKIHIPMIMKIQNTTYQFVYCWKLYICL